MLDISQYDCPKTVPILRDLVELAIKIQYDCEKSPWRSGLLACLLFFYSVESSFLSKIAPILKELAELVIKIHFMLEKTDFMNWRF